MAKTMRADNENAITRNPVDHPQQLCFTQDTIREDKSIWQTHWQSFV
jgi:hypothetical protein